MAHAIAEHLAASGSYGEWLVDSCGTGAWHVGEDADPRTVEVLARHGIRRQHRARQLRDSDFKNFDHLLAMDGNNLTDLQRRSLKLNNATAQLDLIGTFDPEQAGDVGDPYYGGPEGFDIAYQQITRSLEVFLSQHSES